MEFEERPFSEVLGAIVDNRGKTCPTEDVGIPLIATNCVRNDLLYPTYDKSRFVSESTYKTWFRGHPEPGDILFVNKATPGRVCLVPDPIDFCIAQDMVAVRADPEKIYPKYLFAVLRSPLVQSRIEQMQVGTLIPHFKKGDFDKLLLPVPDRPIQEVIGDIYFELSAKIDSNRRTNETLEAMARALFKDWFVDFGPVRAKHEGREPYLAPELWSLFPDEMGDDELPVGWSREPLSSFIELIGGGTPKTSEPSYWDGAIPWFSVVDAPSSSDVFVLRTQKYITEQGLASCSARLLPELATIISARGTVGRLAIVGRPMAMNQSCYAVWGAGIWRPYFVYFILKEAVQRLQANTHGSVFDTITRKTFDSVSSIRPLPEIGAAFESSVAPWMEQIKANNSESETLAELRDTLLPKLLSGELRVRDAERHVETAL